MSKAPEHTVEAADYIYERIASLPREKKDVFALLLKKRGREFNSFPLSFAQRRLWFLDQLDPGNPAYNLHVAVRLQGRLNIGPFARTLNAIVKRHESLRSIFLLIDEEPVQVVIPAQPLALPIVDLSGLPAELRDSFVRRLATQEAQLPFDLTRSPLIRCRLLRLAEDDHVALVTMHHIASDGWSIGILIDEVATLYRSFSAGKPSPIPDLERQYVDFAVWQRKKLHGESLNKLLSYWKSQLAGMPQTLKLPTDRVRSAAQTFQGARETLALSPSLSESLKALSESEGVTLFMALLAAFKTLIYKYSGQEDIVVGTSIANRNSVDVEKLIGFFVNNLALRTDLSGNPTFREAMRRVRKVTLGAYAHQDLPFERLVEELNPERTLATTPLFQALFVLQNAPMSALRLPDLTFSMVENDFRSSKIDLALFVSDTPDGLMASLEYSTDLFDSSTIVDMLQNFQRLLEDVVVRPDEHILALSPAPGRILAPQESVRISTDDLSDIYNRSNLTKNQLLFWMAHKLHPEAPLCNLAHTFTLGGGLRVDHFQRAFRTLVNSSDALRTVIHEIDGIPQQEVISDFPYTPQFIDLADSPEPDAEMRAMVDARSKTPFDLETRLFDSALIRVSPDRFVWFMSEHQIISDAVGASLIFHRMSELYELAVKAELPEAIDLPPFQDYIDYERGYRRSAECHQAEAYWTRKLARAFEPMTFYGRAPIKKSSRVERVSVDLGGERTAGLKSLAGQDGIFVKTLNASIFNVLAATLFAYLYRISGNKELALGIPFHNRRSEAFRKSIGLFMEVLPLRVIIDNDETFSSLINKVISEASEALKYRQYTLGNPLHNRIYEVVLNYHTAEFSDFCGMLLEEEWIHPGHGDDSLTVQVRDFNLSGSFLVDFEFHCDVFGEQQRDEAIRHFIKVIDACLENPALPLRRVDLLSPAEKQRVLKGFNDTARTLPESLIYTELFEAQVRETPKATAVVADGESLTFSQLNEKANLLAHHIRSAGVGPEVIVGVYLERSLEALVALLGIFKAGGAYMPLDPAYPSERISQILERSRPSLILTVESLVYDLPDNSARVTCLDQGRDGLDETGAENPAAGVQAKNLAYVIYTSGSTGAPKGAMLEHAGMLNHLRLKISDLNLNSRDVVAQTAPLCFDISIWQPLAVLLVGGRVRIVSPEVARSPLRLLAQVERDGISTLEVVPSMLREMLDEIVSGKEPPDISSLRWLILTGEALSPELCQRWLSLYPHIPILNAYGPTECSDDVTHHFINEPPPPEATNVPIGRPVANNRIYLLDQMLLPVPIGSPAEIYVGGMGIGRGYLDDRIQTAEIFVPDPFAEDKGSRLYRTGDLGRHLPDGTIEFLGRIDHQVKVRGFRIELGEIEAALSQHPEVREVVVTVYELRPGDKRLIAYFVQDGDSTPGVSDLRTFLKSILPDYMVPSGFIRLDELPLTPNGKLDRKSLPSPEGLSAELERSYVAPRTPIEEVLVGIWSNVLSVELVGIYDNFFDLGGHSLLVTQVVSRIRDAFDIELSLRTLFEAPTVADLAHNIEAAMKIEQGILALPILPVSREGYLPLSFAQSRLWFIDQLDPGNPAYNIAAAVRFMGPLDVNSLERSFTEIVNRHEALRAAFPISNGEPVQVISPPSQITLPVIDISGLSEQARNMEAERLASREAKIPFDLARGPLLRAVVLRLSEMEHLLLVTLHHIVGDGWSTGIFLRETVALYNAFRAGKSSPLPPLPIQYVDFAVWQREWLQGEALEAQLSYWKGQMSGRLPVLDLPTDRPRPALQTFAGAKQSINLPQKLYESLIELSKQEGVTQFMILLAAFQTLLYRYSGQEDIIVGTPVANRGRSELEAVIGFFVNTLALRTDLSGNPSFRNLLRRVREVTLGAYTHQDVPFEKLVEALEPERDLSLTPLFQVMFILGEAPGEVLGLPSPNNETGLPGLNVSSLPVESGSAKFDLTLVLWRNTQGATASLEYNTDLFDPEKISLILANYHTLLEGILANPEEPIATLPILSRADRRRMLKEWNKTESHAPVGDTLHGLFQAQVNRTPNAIAVVDGLRRLTYRELNSRANRLANHLQSLGVGPEAMVGICTRRSLDMIVAMLATLKAGGAYVPLDAAYPGERLAFMINDSKMTVLLTEEGMIDNLPEHSAHTLYLDGDGRAFAHETELGPVSGVSHGNLAYVIYTSGSTGNPKGVAITHGSAAAFLWWIREVFNQEELAGVLASTSICFDLSVFEIFGPLCWGGVTILAENALEAPTLPAKAEVTLINTVPSAMSELMRINGMSASARIVNLAGEPAPGSLVRQIYDLDSVDKVYNLYGPSEDTTYSTFALLEKDASKSPPIGRPISNTQVYLLDARLEPVPVGVRGELYIGGAGLARCYFERPGLTAEKFIPNPFSEAPGSRLYRTGDLAQYRPDGTIEFQGRLDHQVKIRGYRIELGEIEEAIRKHPNVREAVVQAWGDTPGAKSLVGYVVGNGEAGVTSSELRDFLKLRLPDHMVPTTFVKLDALELTPNGKIDRRALPPPDGKRSEMHGGFTAPRDTLELQLQNIWEDVLGVDSVGVKDNFFSLGGHSLLAVRLMTTIKEKLDRELPLATLFQNGTVEGLADILRHQMPPLTWSPVVAIQPKGAKRPFFCVHPVGGSVLAYYHLARHLGQDQPFFGLQAPDLTEIAEEGDEYARVEDRAAHYIEAIRAIQPRGPYLLGGWSFGGVIAFEMAQQLYKQGDRVSLLALFDSVAPIISFDDINDANTLAGLARELVSQNGGVLAISASELLGLHPDEQLNLVLNKAKTAGIAPADSNHAEAMSWMRRLLKGFRIRLQAFRSYKPEVYPAEITLFRGDINPGHLQDEAMGDVLNLFKDPAHGWSGLSSRSIKVEPVPGFHETLLSEPHVQTVASRLKACIEEIEDVFEI